VVWAVAVAMGIGERSSGGRSLAPLLPRVVARAHQRAGFYVTIAHLEAVAAERSELVGRVVPRDREMLTRGTEVLTDGQDVHVLRAQVPHRDQQLVPLLTQPTDDPRLGESAGIHHFGPSQQLERPGITAAWSRQPVQALDGLEVVVHDVGLRVEHDSQRPLAALEVRDQYLDRRAGPPPPNLGDRRREHLGATVRQIVPVYAGDDDVPELHLLHCGGEAGGLVRVERTRRPVRDRAVGAVPRAHVTEDHEGGGPVLPTFPDVGTMGFLAHRVELQVPHQVLQGQVVGPAGRWDLEPGWFTGGQVGERGGHEDPEDSRRKGAAKD